MFPNHPIIPYRPEYLHDKTYYLNTGMNHCMINGIVFKQLRLILVFLLTRSVLTKF